MNLKRPAKIDSSLFAKEQVEQDKYKKKCKRIKRLIKDLVYENGALCDQIAILQEKTLHMVDERNYLFKKLCTFQPVTKPPVDSEMFSMKVQQVSSGNSESPQNKKPPVAKKKPESVSSNTPANENGGKCSKPSVKKQVAVKKRKPVKTVPVDSAGKPVLPVKLGEITLHCLGEIVDKAQYRTEDIVYPVGYVCSRVYGNLKEPEKQSMYTCKILDGGQAPRFEIAVEGEPDILTGRSIDDLHTGLMERINARMGVQVVNTRGRGAQFFGLKHPTVQSLIRSYANRQVKLEMSGSSGGTSSSLTTVIIEDEKEASVSFKALQRSLSLTRSLTESFHQHPREQSITIGNILM